MRSVVLIAALVGSVLGSACDRVGEPHPGLQFTHAADEKQFADALTKSGVAHRIEVRDGKRFVSWKKEDSQRVERIRVAFLVPPGRNLSLTPKEAQEEFKAWLTANGIRFETMTNLGQEFVVWAPEDTERVKKWPDWKEPPSDGASRP